MKSPQYDLPPSGKKSKWPTLLLLTAMLGGTGYWVWQDQTHKAKVAAEVATLSSEAQRLEQEQQWDRAKDLYGRIGQLVPKSATSEQAYARIAAARKAIAEQELAAARHAYELKNLDAAAEAAQRALVSDPSRLEAKGLLVKIKSAKDDVEMNLQLVSVSEAVNRGAWNEATRMLEPLVAKRPDHAEAKALMGKIRAGKAELEKRLARAKELATQAKQRDRGAFDSAVYALIVEAKTLAPKDPEVMAVFDKISAYPRTMKVPGDIATLNEAIALARPNDRILVSAGVYNEALTIDKTLELAAEGQVIVQTQAADNPVLTLGPGAQNTKVYGIVFRHITTDAAAERFPAVLVRGGAVALRDCQMIHAGGHGLAVIERGRVGAAQCRFENNGWDGVSVQGEGSMIDVRNSVAARNGEHGIDIWNGATATLIGNSSSNNKLNGITIVSGKGAVVADGNQLDGNREFGMVLQSAGSGTVTRNQVKTNLMGGLVVRSGAAGVSLQGNRLTANQGPGLVLESGLDAANYKANDVTANRGKQQIASDMELGD